MQYIFQSLIFGYISMIKYPVDTIIISYMNKYHYFFLYNIETPHYYYHLLFIL